MTAISIATDVPSQIDTLEKLAAWVNLALAAVNPTVLATEGVGYTERAAQAGIFFVPGEQTHRFLGRASLAFDPAYLAGGQKTWQYAIELSNSPLPSSFKAN